MRATIAVCFLVGEVISLIMLFLLGKIQPVHLQATLQLLPALAVGMFASRFVHQRINARFMRWFVQAFAIVSGSVLLIKAI